MKNLLHIVLVILVGCSLGVFGQNITSIDGNWLGALEVNGGKLRFLLKVSKNTDGSLSAKFDSPDQGAKDLPIETITQEVGSVRFSAQKFGISFEGKLNEKGDEINGTFKQGAMAVPFIFRRNAGAVKELVRPQDPQKPYPYTKEEVSYENKKDGVKLAGTLTLPRTAGQHPAVVLITGSGAQDRNETILGHHPFLVLADYLTRRGIAVLRVDDRGVGGSSFGSLNATSENYAGDVLTGVEYLKSRQEINPKQIGLIGHSEGGMIAPMVAVRSTDVAFIVLLAGPGQTGAEIIYSQNKLSLKESGLNPAIESQSLTAVKNILDILSSDADDKLAEQRVKEAFAKQLSAMSEDDQKAFAPLGKSIQEQLPAMMKPWYRYFLAYNPRLTLEKVIIPVLALNGENDTQVPAKENLRLIDEALKTGKNKDYTIKSFPKLNHLFQTSQTGLTNEYGEIEETIAPVVLETIANWISERTSTK